MYVCQCASPSRMRAVLNHTYSCRPPHPFLPPALGIGGLHQSDRGSRYVGAPNENSERINTYILVQNSRAVCLSKN